MEGLSQKLNELTKYYNQKFIVFDKLPLPFRYFKKYNIIDNNILEKYIEPHFNPIMLLLSMSNKQIKQILYSGYNLIDDVNYNTHFIDIKWMNFELSDISINNMCKYFNNIPPQLVNKLQLRYIVFNDLDFYSKIIDKGDIDNYIYIVEKDIDRTKNKYNDEKNEIMKQKNELMKIAQVGEKYYIDIVNFPDNDFILVVKGYWNLYIKKVCKKIIKYSDINYSYLGKRQQIKKEELKDTYLDGMDYRLITTDLKYKYGYEDESKTNIIKYDMTDDDKRKYINFNTTDIDFTTY